MRKPAGLILSSLLTVAGLAVLAEPPAAAVDCQNIHITNTSSTEYIRLKRANGTIRDLLPLEETSGSYRFVQVPATDDVRRTEYVSGSPTVIYEQRGYAYWAQPSVWDCTGWNGYVIRIN